MKKALFNRWIPCWYNPNNNKVASRGWWSWLILDMAIWWESLDNDLMYFKIVIIEEDGNKKKQR